MKFKPGDIVVDSEDYLYRIESINKRLKNMDDPYSIETIEYYQIKRINHEYKVKGAIDAYDQKDAEIEFTLYSVYLRDKKLQSLGI